MGAGDMRRMARAGLGREALSKPGKEWDFTLDVMSRQERALSREVTCSDLLFKNLAACEKG